MSTLNTLKLVVGKRHLTASPAVHRRNKLVNKLHEQLELCEAKQAGKTYAPKQLKTYVNRQTGERMTVETVKRVKEWYWTNEAGKINLAIKYGAKTLMLNKKTKLIIEKVQYEGDNNKEEATLTCVVPEVYTSDVAKNIFI
jgi:hypothetical protein